MNLSYIFVFSSLNESSIPGGYFLSRRVPELKALVADPPYTLLYKDKVSLCLHPKLLTTVMADLHLN